MSSADAVIVLIHGLWMRGLVMRPLAHRLSAELEWPTEIFSYPTQRKGLLPNMADLSRCLCAQQAAKIHLVGHSLGAVLALHTALEKNLPPLGRIVSLGGPLRGSSAGRTVEQWPGSAYVLGRTLSDSVITRPLQRWTGEQELGSIAGTIGVGLGMALPDLKPPHDGMVTVEETQLPGMADHLELPVSHTAMLLAPSVAQQTAHFLRHGRFDHG